MDYLEYARAQSLAVFIKNSGLTPVEVIEAIAQYKQARDEKKKREKLVEDQTQMIMDFVHEKLTQCMN